jgi:hypothetical protein
VKSASVGTAWILRTANDWCSANSIYKLSVMHGSAPA